jgi:hypothetical protein
VRLVWERVCASRPPQGKTANKMTPKKSPVGLFSRIFVCVQYRYGISSAINQSNCLLKSTDFGR